MQTYENSDPTGSVSIIVPTAANNQPQTEDDAETQSQQSPTPTYKMTIACL